MNILVFGASGSAGHQLVRHGLSQGHHVSAFVRSPSRLRVSHGNLKALAGDVGDYDAVARAVEGQDAVLSSLGVRTPLKRDPIVVRGVAHIIQAMARAGVNRLIYLSFVGVKESRDDAGFFVRRIAVKLLRPEIADHEAKEQMIKESPLAWTIVRAPKLTNGPFTGTYRSGDRLVAHSFFPSLTRADVAGFMIRQMTDDQFVRKAPRVMP